MPVYERGARVVVPIVYGHCGLGTVVDVAEQDGDRYNVVQFDPPVPGMQGATLRVLQSMQTWPWPVPTPAQAQSQLARLLTPIRADDRAWKERHQEFQRVVASCEPQAILDFARTQWAREGRPSFAEAKIGRLLQAMVVDPVAEALGMETRAVMAKVKAIDSPSYWWFATVGGTTFPEAWSFSASGWAW